MKFKNLIFSEKPIKKIIIIFSIAFTFMFISCEKDLYEDSLNTSSHKLIIKSLNLNTYKKKPQDLVSFHKKMQKRILNEENNKMVFDSINNFYVDEENTKYIQSGDKESYTISIKKENVPEIENLVFNKREDGHFDIFLVKYEYTPEELKLFTFSEISQKQTKFYPVEFDDNGLMTYKGTTGWTCYDVYSIESEYGYMDVLVWQGWTLMFSICDYDYDDEIGGNSGGGGHNYGSGQNYGGSGGGGTGTNNGNTTGGVYGNGGLDGTGIHTIPIAPKKTPKEIKNAFAAFLANHPNQLAWWNYQANASIVAEIVDYMTINQTYAVEDQTPSDFALECINQIMQNPTVFTSFKPFVIEKQIDDSQLDPCTKGILNKLKQNHTIAKIINRFDSPESDFRILMSQVPNLTNPNGQVVYAETESITNLQFQIKLNSNYYNDSGSTHIGKVGTILHEIIHALIMSICSNSNNPSLNGSTDFPTLWNYYVTNIQGQGTLTNQLQHQWMTTYQSVIQDALVEYATTTSTNPPIGQTIQEFCFLLSWNGIYTGPNGIPVPNTTLAMSDKIKVLLQKQAEMTNSIAPNNTLPSNNPPCN